MKKRANRLLALLVSATMVATPYASVSTVYAENTDAAESTGFADVWETEDSQRAKPLVQMRHLVMERLIQVR